MTRDLQESTPIFSLGTMVQHLLIQKKKKKNFIDYNFHEHRKWTVAL